MTLTSDDAARFERTIARGGIAIFPTDTLYGIACDPDSAAAARRIYELKGRPPVKPSAVMFFSVERLLEQLPELDGRVRELVTALLPGPFTLVVENPLRRFAPACAQEPGKLGLRVPALNEKIAALANVRLAVMQTSANRSGEPDAVSLAQIDPAIRAGVDLELDGGRLPGVGSTVVDLSRLSQGRWHVLREPVAGTASKVAELLGFPPQG